MRGADDGRHEKRSGERCSDETKEGSRVVERERGRARTATATTTAQASGGSGVSEYEGASQTTSTVWVRQ